MLTQAPRGTMDMLPGDSHKVQRVEAIEREISALHGFREIRTPVFEHTELFLRSVGDTTDVVQKEMYTFDDKGGRSLTLKPEGTAGVVRAFIEHGLHNEPLPLGVYYLNSPVFRYEAPQKGRYREHHQFGAELFGAAAATADAEVIQMAADVIRRVGLRGVELHLNSIGCPECRPDYQRRLLLHFAPHIGQLCEDCKGRFERNPMRLLDCKDPRCQPFKAGAPTPLDCLCDACREHFGQVKASLERLGMTYIVDTTLVRGLDYYTRTVFEFILPGEPTVGAGGRYDLLVEQIGGPHVPAIGFGMGTERLVSLAEGQGVDFGAPALFQAMALSLGDEARAEAFSLAAELRALGIRATCDQAGRSLKAQFKYAGKLNIPYCAIIAPDELAAGIVKIRDMAAATEESVPRAAAAQYIQQKLEAK